MAGPIIPIVVVAGRIAGQRIAKILAKRVGKTNVAGVTTIAGNVAGAGAAATSGKRLKEKQKATKRARGVRRK